MTRSFSSRNFDSRSKGWEIIAFCRDTATRTLLFWGEKGATLSHSYE